MIENFGTGTAPWADMPPLMLRGNMMKEMVERHEVRIECAYLAV